MTPPISRDRRDLQVATNSRAERTSNPTKDHLDVELARDLTNDRSASCDQSGQPFPAWCKENRRLARQAVRGDDDAFFQLLRRDPSYVAHPLCLKRIRAWRLAIDPDDQWRPDPGLEERAAAGNREALFALLRRTPAVLRKPLVLQYILEWRQTIRAFHPSWEVAKLPWDRPAPLVTPISSPDALPVLRRSNSLVYGLDAMELKAAKRDLRHIGLALIPDGRGRPRKGAVRPDPKKAAAARSFLRKIGSAFITSRQGEKPHVPDTLIVEYEYILRVCRRLRVEYRRRCARGEWRQTIMNDLAARSGVVTEEVGKILNPDTRPHEYAVHWLADHLRLDPGHTHLVKNAAKDKRQLAPEVLARHLASALSTGPYRVTPRRLLRTIRDAAASPTKKK